MLVCHCRKVTDRMIRAAIQEGATCEEHVAEMCGAGTRCGGCIPAVSELLDEAKQSTCHVHVRLPVLRVSHEW